MNKFGIIVVSIVISTAADAQNFEVPHTEFGLPDFRGVWNFSTPTPLQRPEHFGDKEFLTAAEVSENATRRQLNLDAYLEQEETISERIAHSSSANSVGSVNYFWGEFNPLRENLRTSLITYPSDGRIPPTNPGVPIQKGDWIGILEIPGTRPVRYTHGGIGRDGPEDRGLSERCLVFNSGPPLRSGPYNNNIQIFQGRDHVVILTEMGFDARIVPLDNRVHIDEKIQLWSGDSRGYFEGNALVVETTNFTNKIASLGLQDIAYGSAEDRLLIETFSITGKDTLDYEFTIDDPNTFTDKITAVIPMTKTSERIYEYACHEGNYALANILKGAGEATKATSVD